MAPQDRTPSSSSSLRSTDRTQNKRFSSSKKSTRGGESRRTNNVPVSRGIVVASPSDTERLQRVLENLNIRFTNCTFSYKTSHFVTESTKKKSKSFSRRIASTLQRVRETLSPNHTFEKCLFVPVAEQEDVKNYVLKNLPEMEIYFDNCKFIKRSSTLIEKVRRRLRKVFGTVFELEYINATATIDHYTFRIKDIWDVYQYIQERIAEVG